MTQPKAPGVILHLLPNGHFCAALPHEDGTTLTVSLPVDQDKMVKRLREILQAQLTVPKLTGHASAPTEWQVIRAAMEDHPDRSRTVRRQATVIAEHGGVVIRRLAPKSRKLTKPTITLADLDL